MNDIANLAPDLARLIGVNPATLVLLIVIVSKAANIVARRIPDDATGWLGITRKVAAIAGGYVSSKVTAEATVAQVARAALETPPIDAKVAVDTAGNVAPDLIGALVQREVAKALRAAGR